MSSVLNLTFSLTFATTQLVKPEAYFMGEILTAVNLGAFYFSSDPVSVIARISSIVNKDNTTSDISFDPFKVYICVDGDIDQLECQETEEVTVWGKEITLQAVVVNHQRTNVPNSYVRTSADNGAQIDANQNIQKKWRSMHTNILSSSERN